MLALLAGLGAAFWQSRARSQSLEIALLLNHIAVSIDGVVIDHQRLTDVGWRLADHDPKTWNWQHFTAGSAPDLTEPMPLKLPNDVTALEIACKFQLLPGSPPLRTLTRVPVPSRTDGVVPVDVESCGAIVR